MREGDCFPLDCWCFPFVCPLYLCVFQPLSDEFLSVCSERKQLRKPCPRDQHTEKARLGHTASRGEDNVSHVCAPGSDRGERPHRGPRDPGLPHGVAVGVLPQPGRLSVRCGLTPPALSGRKYCPCQGKNVTSWGPESSELS